MPWLIGGMISMIVFAFTGLIGTLQAIDGVKFSPLHAMVMQYTLCFAGFTFAVFTAMFLRHTIVTLRAEKAAVAKLIKKRQVEDAKLSIMQDAVYKMKGAKCREPDLKVLQLAFELLESTSFEHKKAAFRYILLLRQHNLVKMLTTHKDLWVARMSTQTLEDMWQRRLNQIS